MLYCGLEPVVGKQYQQDDTRVDIYHALNSIASPGVIWPLGLLGTVFCDKQTESPYPTRLQGYANCGKRIIILDRHTMLFILCYAACLHILDPLARLLKSW